MGGFADAIADAYATLSSESTTPVSVLSDAGVDHVYDHETGPGGLSGTVAVTVAPGPVNAEMWHVRVRLYVKVLDPEAAQGRLVAALEVLDTVFDSTFGHAPWEGPEILEAPTGGGQSVLCYLYTTDLPVIRGDF